MEREQCVTMERKWPGGDVERREGRVGVMEREQWMVMVTEGRVGGDGEVTVGDDGEGTVGGDGEGTVGGDGDRRNSGW